LEKTAKLGPSYIVLIAKYNYNDQVKEDEMRRTCSRKGEKRNTYRILVVKPEGNRPLGRPRHKWENNSKMDLREIGWRNMDWIHLASCRPCEHEPSGSKKRGGGILDYLSDWRLLKKVSSPWIYLM
jgi:hypothetical protein